MKTENGCAFITKPRAQLAFENDTGKTERPMPPEVLEAAMKIASLEGKMEALEEEVSRLSSSDRPSMLALSKFQVQLQAANMNLQQARAEYEYVTHGSQEPVETNDQILQARWAGRREGLGAALSIDNYCGLDASDQLRNDFQEANTKVRELQFQRLTQASPRLGSRLWAPMTEVLKK